MKPNLKYRIARPEDLPVIKKHLQEYFWGHDPTTKVLGINKDDPSIKICDYIVDKTINSHNLSLVAFDSDTGVPVAMMINGDFHRDEIGMLGAKSDENTEEKVELDEKFYPLGAIVNEIQVDSKDVFYKNNIENAFDMKLLSVADSGRGQGLAYDVISRSVELAKCLGYKMCKAEATGDFSRKAFLKAGFHVTAECKYSDWMFDNKKVFSGITDHQGIAFVVKIL